MASRMLKLRREDVCFACGRCLSVGSAGWWDAKERRVTCIACVEKGPDGKAEGVAVEVAGVHASTASELVEPGQAGASAEREYERRKQRREAETRQAHPHIGGLLLALREPPHHEYAFHEGALGEQAVARSLARRTADSGVLLLHDRRMPRGRGNIDHLAIAPTGVFVIDAKNHKGKVEIARQLFGKPKLLVGRRDHTTLLDGLDRQVHAVRAALDDDHSEMVVRGVLCFPNADFPLFGTLEMRGHLLLSPKSVAKRLNASGSVSPRSIEALAARLAREFPSA